MENKFEEKIYAGVLGKIIGVYFGRPVEGWSYEKIMENFGEIDYYVNDSLKVPIIVPDDDISGTFAFVRTIEDNNFQKDLKPKAVGKTWLNYIIEEETILWWGGLGRSTEHTAFINLKNGIDAPYSGSHKINGPWLPSQIGAQIFIDAWAMVSPGDPELAVEFAKKAASVSHDGEAIYGAQVIAAMEAQAFVESDRQKLIEIALSFIPKESLIYKMVQDLRELHIKEPDWRKALGFLSKHYGNDIYGGGCHMIPNHGLIIFSLLYGDDDFQKTMMIVNTSGWDTDCNSGNLGCLMGIKNGLEGINRGPDWRSPFADKIYIPTADGGRSISDAASEAIYIANMCRSMNGFTPELPKNGARFHFELPGSLQGFTIEKSITSSDTTQIYNSIGYSLSGERSLAIHYTGLAKGRISKIETPTFSPSIEISKYFKNSGYPLMACPTIYSGQKIKGRIVADESNSSSIQCSLYIKHYNELDEFTQVNSDVVCLKPESFHEFEWEIPDTKCYPIAFVGVQLEGEQGQDGKVYLDYIDWQGEPKVKLNSPVNIVYGRHITKKNPNMWKDAWIDGLDVGDNPRDGDTYRLIQNVGRGLLIQGTRQWKNYKVSVRMTPHMCEAGGIGIRVQGMTRYYALLLKENETHLIRSHEGKDTILASSDRSWKLGEEYEISLEANENKFVAWINKEKIIETQDLENFYTSGAMALISQKGRVACNFVEIEPAIKPHLE